MNLDELRDSLIPYLQAIQNIPGNTAGEKLSWIGKSASSLDVIENLGHLHPEVLSLLRVEAALKHKRHEDITLALKSKDWTIVKRALKATWFFDGSQEIINATYFSEHVFPHISQHTKTRIVRTFARCIKDPLFAQAIFNAVKITYTSLTALPVLMICDQEFIRETIIRITPILPVYIFKKIYYKNPEFGLWLIKEYIRHPKKYMFYNRRSLRYNKLPTIIQEYKYILHALAKKRSLEFVNIVQSIIKHEAEHLISKIGVLSKKCAKKFLKEARNVVIEYPSLYLSILPSEVIHTELWEIMLPNLMNYHIRESSFTDKMLNYLKDLPEDKKVEIFSKTYKNLYRHELLDKWENVTPALLKILPINERIEWARKRRITRMYVPKECYSTDWTCYLSAHEAISFFKALMKCITTEEYKLNVILKMIYTCKVNKNEDELYNVLLYIIDGEYIINDSVEALEASKVIHKIFEICEVSFLNKRNGSLLYYILQSFYIKYKDIYVKTFVDMIYVKFINNLPIADLMDIYMDMLENGYVWPQKLSYNNAQCERECLIYVIERIITNLHLEFFLPISPIRRYQKIIENRLYFLRKRLSQLIIEMYVFNEKWCKDYKHTKIEPLRIINYPVLMDTFSSFIRITKNTFFLKKAKSMLRRNEPDLYHSWCVPHKNIANVTSRAALCLLKNNYQSILDNWEKYLTNCKKCRGKNVRRFIRATRWYKDIPINFAVRCISSLRTNQIDKSSVLTILNILHYRTYM